MLKRIPFLWRYADRLDPKFPGSQHYWDSRYVEGGNSGGGSYGQLAEFKAEVLNEFVAREQIQTVIEFGVGDGNQLSLAAYPRYIGLDVSKTIIKRVTDRFRTDPTKSFFLYDPECFSDPAGFMVADLVLSLDVIYHLVEEPVYAAYLKHLFAASRRYVVIYSSDTEKILVNTHERHRKFSTYVENHFKDWKLDRRLSNRFPQSDFGPEGSFCDFFFYQRREIPSTSGD